MLLKIKDREYGLEWGMLAFESLEDELGESGHQIIIRITEELSNKRDRTLRKLAYEAIKLWCKKNDKEVGITYYDFVDWLDREPQDSKEVKHISASFYASWYQGKQISEWIDYIINLATQSVEEGDKETTKKKATRTQGRKSSGTASSGGSKRKSTTT
ncbi:hypothetical protein G5B30_07075 [Sphingobacterium sp. SGG-5]|uniref:hypothetical protein n=1 Tax=Sphingobacterium sp. SGG-5 TaxID=2710881 RepID=UPI0013EBB93B|nr:hypothetical protein [Sphingobacterium sp. SGG-5]NGM61678.1 hypothetical protein [Sphingobacterium sp. SGG-5]